jgi:hypothetical protein
MLKTRLAMAHATSKKLKNGETPRRWVRSVRFDFDRHGARSAFVPVEGASTQASTREASMLIAAAIRQAWAGDGADDESRDDE